MAKTEPRKRVVLVPYPFQGHITPMLQLASILDSNGFSITVAHPQFSSPDPSDHPRLTFVPLPDGLDESFDTSFNNTLNLISTMNANCEAPFEEQLMKMLRQEEEGCGDVACVVYDAIMKFVDGVASRLRVPTVVLRTTTAAYIHSYKVFFQLLDQKLIPVPESKMGVPIPDMHPLRFKDMPLSSVEEIPDPVLDFMHDYMDIRSSSAVIWNTVESLEPWPLRQLHQESSVPFFPVGPLHKMAQPSQTNLFEEDNTCLSWLDKQSPNSVVFISLGSLAVISEEELIEMAWGIAKSEHPFLWAIRPSLLEGCDPIKCLPQNFMEITRERGCVVKWAPQKKVLAHSAVGAFLTHCGWNSTLEGMCEGVPLICRPCFSDQTVNARYVTDVWGNGLELESVKKNGYERAIRTTMGSEQGRKMRQRALCLKQELEHSISVGASCESLGRLVEFIASLTTRAK